MSYTSATLLRAASADKILRPSSWVHSTPQDVVPADVELVMGHSHSYQRYRPPLVPDPALSWEDLVGQIPQGDAWAVAKLTAGDHGAAIAALTQAQTAKAVSDGSYEDDFSTSAFILTASTREAALDIEEVQGCNCVPGHPQEQSSYRGELGGVMVHYAQS